METIVSFAVTKLTDLVAQEVELLLGVDGELKSLRDLLQWIEALLKDTDIHSNQDNDERAKLWVNQVRDLAYDAEDIVDDYIFKVHQHSSPFFPARQAARRDLSTKICKLKGKAQEIYDNRSKFGNYEGSRAPSSDPLLSWPRANIDEEDVDFLGFDEHFQALTRLLIVGDNGNQSRAIISITGMGGVGKTTLAKKIFSDPGIRRHFTCLAWVWVSQECRARQVLETVAKGVLAFNEGMLNSLGYEDLKERVTNYLKERRYLVILDDIWSKRAWKSIEGALPTTMNGSRVLLTTRNQDVALYADPQSPPYDMKILGEEDSWELFCRKAIPTKCSKDCLLHLASIGKEMVAKCCGLPLAITVLGSLVSTKHQSAEEWGRLLKKVNWELREGEDQISEILALSYHHLPYCIKPCFLYFSIYTKGALISAKRLIRLWIGFIQPRDQETREEVAEDYLEMLVHLNMIQVVERHHNDRIKICQIHELLHDLSIFLAQGMNFIHIPTNNNDNQENILHKPRRLAIHDDKNMKKSISEMEKFFNIKLLRVINIQGTKIKSLPSDIGTLIHLKYLGLRHTNLRELPSSICRLTKLQTLDIKHSLSIRELPSEVWKMRLNLRHLEGKYFSIKGLPSTESLPNIQTLSGVQAGKWLQNGLQKMTSLCKLGIHGVTRTCKEALFDCLGNLDNLTKLAWKAVKDGTIPSSIFSTSQHKHNLKVLDLRGPLEGLLDSYCMLANITKLTLQCTRLQEDPLVLRLRYDAFVGREIVCLEKGFPQLKVLELKCMFKFEVWRIEDEAMPKLKELQIENCGLVMLPQGLQKVTTLQELKVINMHDYFCGRLANNDGEDWEKIKHIPSVRVYDCRPMSISYSCEFGV
ncbi:P-loop containing nucleoside triphosphate hydrolase protein [Dioscorea alata]|uniref:P-loop containing nucleoside triphosphate hydrolase protein n=1 Tax=Dioscorea alata TaxID=55571 RepID=A0ACB7VJL1_DIOAL|nr:P-loop containing nucleoside triphosphate hydrolase protein [Dioscorea alata]